MVLKLPNIYYIERGKLFPIVLLTTLIQILFSHKVGDAIMRAIIKKIVRQLSNDNLLSLSLEKFKNVIKTEEDKLLLIDFISFAVFHTLDSLSVKDFLEFKDEFKDM